jgi:phage terminase large subunit
VSRRFRNTFNAVERGKAFEADDLIAISSECDHLDRLIDELSTPPKDYDNSGRSKVESKKDLDKRDIPSPDLADAFVMAFAPRTGSFTLSNI